MSCIFCKEIGHMNDIEKSAKHSDCFLFKDSASNIGFGMHIGDATYVTGIDFCPYCGRKLKEECSIVDSECEHCACELLDQRDEARALLQQAKEEFNELVEKVNSIPNINPISYGNLVEALGKQIPKKPIIWENRHYFSPSPNDDWGYECPCCGNQEIDYPEHHCTCGQALDWNDINI